MTSLSTTDIPTDSVKCKHCGSTNTIKSGQTQAREPKQKWYCHACHRFFVTKLD